MKKIFSAFICLSVLFVYSCNSEDNDEKTEPPKKEFTLKDAPFHFGMAVNGNLLKKDIEYQKILIDETTSITAEHQMKMALLYPNEAKYYWTEADELVNFAQSHNKRIHGHTLIWHTSTPEWVYKFEGDRTAWINLMEDYISTVVTHFKGKVTSWDVVNEALTDEGEYRPTIWYEKIGPEYIELAFRAARKADPDVLLFYNDYGTEYSSAKGAKLVEMVKKFQARKVPIDGIGLQMHITMQLMVSNLSRAIDEVVDLNLLLHISELDISVSLNDNKPDKFTEDLAIQQKEKYKDVANAMLNVPSRLRYGITIWGVDDNHSWLTNKPDWPLLFNNEYKKKTAYYGLQEIFEKK